MDCTFKFTCSPSHLITVLGAMLLGGPFYYRHNSKATSFTTSTYLDKLTTKAGKALFKQL